VSSSHPLELPRLRAAFLAAVIACAAAFAVAIDGPLPSSPAPPFGAPAGSAPSPVTPPVARMAETAPGRPIDVIVQLRAGADAAAVRSAVRAAGGTVTREVQLINGLAVRLEAAAAASLGTVDGIRAVSLDAPVVKTGAVLDPSGLASSYNQSIRADKAWQSGFTGRGIGVAVIDTGVRGDLADFRGDDGTSRVVASAVVNPAATDASDTYGHGTHIAGLIAGNGAQRTAGDPLAGRYAGVAPDANVIAVKADDGHGGSTVLDVIDGLQFVVDQRASLGIRVANLSLSSTVAESHLTDPLDAAVEAAWLKGVTVVVAAGNRGAVEDAVHFAPANDPWVITVGAVDDLGTKSINDDRLTNWSSRGITQDGVSKPDLLAPGAKLVSNLAPGSDYASLCPECVTEGQYFRVGGTSMAAAVASGAVATILQAHPEWTPDQVKAAMLRKSRPVENNVTTDGIVVDSKGKKQPDGTTVTSTVVGGEIAIDKVLNAYSNSAPEPANVGLARNTLVDAAGTIDFSRASWTRASWTEAAEPMRASWTRASWTRASWTRASWTATEQSCADFERASWTRASWTDAEIAAARADCTQLLASIDPARASWTRASWTRASWTSSFEK
jgi:serine protease AprX